MKSVLTEQNHLELSEFEKRFGLSSADFATAWDQGLLGDCHTYLRWRELYFMWEKSHA